MRTEPLVASDLISIPPLQPEGWADITPSISYYTRSAHCLPIKVTIDNNIAGIGCGIHHHNVGWAAHIIVHPAHRNKGLGTMITKNIIDILHARGCTTINLIATDLGAPVYARLGFVTDTEYYFFKYVTPPLDIRVENIHPYHLSFKNDIEVLDRMASAENRLIDFEPHLQKGFVYRERGQITGFYLPAFGDGCVIASTTRAGIALMEYRLLHKDNACFPVDNPAALSYMNGKYSVDRIAKRMRLGPPIPWKPTMMYNRIAGNFG